MKYPFIVILTIIICLACEKSHKVYYENGKVKVQYEIKNGKKDGGLISYYPNGNIDIKGSYTDNQKNGWWSFYDSSSRVLKEKYYYHGNVYTDINFDRLGKCSYAKLRPRILDNRDTMYVSSTDSIQLVFNQKNKYIEIKKYLIKVFPDSDTTVDAYYLVCPIKNSYIYFDNELVYKRNVLYYIEISAMQSENEKLCCCDNIICDVTSKYVYIK